MAATDIITVYMINTHGSFFAVPDNTNTRSLFKAVPDGSIVLEQTAPGEISLVPSGKEHMKILERAGPNAIRSFLAKEESCPIGDALSRIAYQWNPGDALLQRYLTLYESDMARDPYWGVFKIPSRVSASGLLGILETVRKVFSGREHLASVERKLLQSTENAQESYIPYMGRKEEKRFKGDAYRFLLKTNDVIELIRQTEGLRSDQTAIFYFTYCGTVSDYYTRYPRLAAAYREANIGRGRITPERFTLPSKRVFERMRGIFQYPNKKEDIVPEESFKENAAENALILNEKGDTNNSKFYQKEGVSGIPEGKYMVFLRGKQYFREGGLLFSRTAVREILRRYMTLEHHPVTADEVMILGKEGQLSQKKLLEFFPRRNNRRESTLGKSRRPKGGFFYGGARRKTQKRSRQ